jgi:hypothetical protein
MDGAATRWAKIDPDGLAEGQVMTVVAGGRALCLTRTAAGYGAPDNRRPHQGRPRGEHGKRPSPTR